MDLRRRTGYLRPITVAMALAAMGEAIYFVVWGLWLFPEGDVLAMAAWTATCVVAMGAVIGAGVIAFVVERVVGLAAVICSAAIYAVVLSACTLICASLDSHFDYFGGATAPTLFVLAGLIPAILTSGVYGWLLYSRAGNGILLRVGL